MKVILQPVACCICFMLFFSSYAQDGSENGKPASQNETKKVAEELAKKKKSVLKLLTDKLKFKKNAREKEKERIITLVKDLGLEDSIAVNANNIQVIIRELDKKENQHFDSLKKIISAIRSVEQNTSKAATFYPVEQSAANNSLSDQDIETLANQVLPLLNEKLADEKEEEEKQETIKKLKLVRNVNEGVIHSQKVSDSIIKRYKIVLKNRAEVFGFYDGTAGAFPNSALLSSLSSLVYHALLIDDTTGEISISGRNTSPVVNAAQRAGCKVYFTVQLQNKGVKASLLYNTNAQQKCINNMLELLANQHANGILISFKNLTKKDRNYFTDFVQLASKALKLIDPSYQLFVTVPRFDVEKAYDVQALNEYADRFFIDFVTNTTLQCAPLAPLKGSKYNSIENSFSLYESQGIEAKKMVLMLPYRGTRWQVRSAVSKQDVFLGYLNVGAIQRQYGHIAIYDDATSSAYIDTVYPGKQAYRIWYDNDITLGEKYDYILENNIGGAGIFSINYDDGSRELRDELIYRFAFADTVYLQDSVIRAYTGLSFFQKAYRYMALYAYILQHPCANCFEGSALSPGEGEAMLAYIKDLKIDSIVQAEAMAGRFYRNRGSAQYSFTISLHDKFDYINQQLNTGLFHTTLVLMIFSLAFVCIYVLGSKYNGEGWRLKKAVVITLFIFSSLFMLSAFTFCFTNDVIPLFGVSGLPVNNCNIDPGCINMPFSTLLLIIVIGMLIGLMLFRYLIASVIKREDVP